jgi:hypothetical protein
MREREEDHAIPVEIIEKFQCKLSTRGAYFIDF